MQFLLEITGNLPEFCFQDLLDTLN